MDRKIIKAEAKAAVKGTWFMFFVLVLVIGVISVPLFFLAPLGVFALYLVSLDLLDGKPLNANRIVDTVRDLNHALKIIAVFFLQGLIILVGYILFIIPGIIFTFMYSQALYIMIDNPDLDIMEALSRSKEMMKGHKMELFVFQLSFLGHILLGIITFGIYMVYVIPYQNVALVNYYKHLKAEQLGVIDVEVAF